MKSGDFFKGEFKIKPIAPFFFFFLFRTADGAGSTLN